MMITIKTGAKGRRKALVEGNMTIYEAAADKQVLLSALAKASELEVDLSSLRDMDTAGLQLLILLKRESLKSNIVMRLVGHSSALHEVLTAYNMDAYFADPGTSGAQPKVQSRQFR